MNTAAATSFLGKCHLQAAVCKKKSGFVIFVMVPGAKRLYPMETPMFWDFEN